MKLLGVLFLTSSAWRGISSRPIPGAGPDAEAEALYRTYGDYFGYNTYGRGAVPAPGDFAQPQQLYGGFGGYGGNGVQLLGGYGGGRRRLHHEPNYDFSTRHSQLRHGPFGAGGPGRYLPQARTYPDEDRASSRRPGGFERPRSSGGIPENAGAICCSGLNAVVGGFSSTQDGSVI